MMLYVISILVVILGVALDQYTKYLATLHLKDHSVVLIDGVFQLQYLENQGAAFGLLQNQQLLFFLVNIVTLVFLTILYVRMPVIKRYIPLRICMLSIAAGAIGNMIDRIRFQYVVDFFYFELIDFPIFNVADIFASVATCVLAVLLLFYYKDQDFDIVFNSLKFKKRKEQE